MFKPMDLVQEAIERHGKHIAVACSFSKDSIDVLKMALEINPKIVVIHENTGVAFPETVKFKKKIAEEWKLNLYETKPIKTFWECEKEYGLPTIRKGGGKGSNAPKCCEYLKEKPALILQKELGINAIITGLQSCESQNRWKLAMRYENKKAPYTEREFEGEIVEFCGQRWYVRNTGTWNYHPIMHDSTFDVWKRTLDESTPINEVYTKWDKYSNVYDDPKIELVKKGYLLLEGNPALYNRCGCLPCTAYLDWEKNLSISHPALYRKLKRLQCPNQTKLDLKGGGQ